jgi:hypothetical protein
MRAEHVPRRRGRGPQRHIGAYALSTAIGRVARCETTSEVRCFNYKRGQGGGGPAEPPRDSQNLQTRRGWSLGTSKRYSR